MIYESKLEIKTKGLVFGPAILSAQGQSAYLLKKKKELFVPKAFVELPVFQPKTWKVVVRSREGKEILWVRPFCSFKEAVLVYTRLMGLDLDIYRGRTIQLPYTYLDGELEICIFTVYTYNSSNSTNADWPTGNKVPAGFTTVDYLVVAGGGGGGNDSGAGGGAGGLLTATGFAVTAGNQVTITVGTGGTFGASSANGTDSTFSSVTATGGGRGGSNSSQPGGNGGSGGGSRNTSGGGTGVSGQGYAGADLTGSAGGGAGGGGAGSAGGYATGSPARNGGVGGTGVASSISGSSLNYAGGGGGCGWAGGGSGGAGGSSVGGTGSSTGSATTPTANRGGGGGGTDSGTASAGADGVIILSGAPSAGVFSFNVPMMGM